MGKPSFQSGSSELESPGKQPHGHGRGFGPPSCSCCGLPQGAVLGRTMVCWGGVVEVAIVQRVGVPGYRLWGGRVGASRCPVE
jgi:hypothetical protein